MSAFKKTHFSPIGQLLFACVFQPDTGSKISDGKHKVTLRLAKDDAEKLNAVFAALEDDARRELEAPDDAEIFLPMKQAQVKDKESGKRVDLEGYFDFTFKTKKAPNVVDARQRRVMEKDIPGAKNFMNLGVGMVSFQPYPWKVSDRKGTEYGINAYLQVVQIRERNSFSQDMSGFEDYEDGFSVSEDETNDQDNDAIPDFAS